MSIVPRWARAKVLKAKRNRRNTANKLSATQRPMMQTMSYKDEFGAVIKYRDHVRINKATEPDVPDATRWHGYPVEFVAFLRCFDNVPDDQLPPLVAVTRKRKKEWQSTIRGQGTDHTFCILVSENSFRRIFCFLSGRIAYFVWLSKHEGKAMRSADYTADHARQVISKHSADCGGFTIEHYLQWIEIVDKIPATSSAT